MTIFIPLQLNRSRILRSSRMVDIYFFLYTFTTAVCRDEKLGLIHSIYFRTVSSQFFNLVQCYIRILPGWSGAEIECTVHVALPKLPINQLKPVMQSRQHVLRTCCPNIHIVILFACQIRFWCLENILEFFMEWIVGAMSI